MIPGLLSSPPSSALRRYEYWLPGVAQIDELSNTKAFETAIPHESSNLVGT